MKNFLFRSLPLILVFCLVLPGCKKDSSSEKGTYVFDSAEMISNARLFTNGIEVTGDGTINSYIDRFSFPVTAQILESDYANDSYTFSNDTTLAYVGTNNAYYNTLYYTKSDTMLTLVTDTIHFYGNMFKKNYPTFNDIFAWTIDSIDYITSGVNPVSVYRLNKRFKLDGNKMYIPVLGYYYRYRTGAYKIAAYDENEFNESVINELGADSLAIIEFKLKFVRK